jgi:hypothetical protein
MPRFRKKPVVIEAEQFSRTKHYPSNKNGGKSIDGLCWESVHDTRYVETPHVHALEGVHHISEGDWVITGVKGEKYFCKPDIFAATYELVEE